MRYEYMEAVVNTVDELSDLGLEGWKVIPPIARPNISGMRYIALMERVLPEPTLGAEAAMVKAQSLKK